MARPLNVNKRIRSLIDSIVKKIWGGERTNAKGKPSVDKATFDRAWNLGRSRAEKPTRDLEAFYFVQDILSNCPAVTRALRKLSEDAAIDENSDDCGWTTSFKIQPADDSDESRKSAVELGRDLQRVVDDFIRRTGIGYNTKHYIYKILSAGDCFAEQDITIDSRDGFGQIERIKELPTWQMRPVWDENGDLSGYKQFTTSNDKFPVTWDIPEQIIHWKFNRSEYYPFGESILAPLRGKWEQFKLLELDLIAAIHTRAVAPEVHILGREGTAGQEISDKDVENYKQQLRDNPSDINRFYVVRAGEKKIEFPKTQDTDAVRVLLEAHRELQGEFVTFIGVPLHLSGNPQEVDSRRLASSLDSDYSRHVSSVRQDFWFFLQPAIYLELALHGYNLYAPEDLGVSRIQVELVWPDLIETRIQKSKRIVTEWSIGLISHETALRERGLQDPNGEIALIMDEREKGDFPLIPAGSLPQISNNDEQGPGVQPDNEPENQPQTKSAILQMIAEYLNEQGSH